MTFHKHRLLPGHMGGTYDSANVIRVNVAMHAFLHKMLWQDHGRWQDRIAWQVLSGMISKEEGRVQAVAEAKREQWKDPAFRERIIASHTSPDALKKRSDKMVKHWKHAGSFRAKVAAAQMKRWADPKAHDAMSRRVRGKRFSLGYRHDTQALAKISAASREQWVSFSLEKRQAIIAKRVATRLRNKTVH